MPKDLPASLSAANAFTLNRPAEDFPSDIRAHAALLMLDTLGVCIAAHPMQAGHIARESALRLYGSTTDTAPMMFDGRPVSRAGSAFAAATQIDNLDAHDGYNPTKGHIGVAVVPALFALAHDQPDLTGAEALAAMIVGYEVAGRAGIALHATATDYHTSGAWNALGVAAMAARLMGLDAHQLREALGIAEYHGPRSQMMREIANPTMLHDGSGIGAMVGVSAAVMAQLGFNGAPAITVEDPEVAVYWQDLGSFWQTAHQYIKPYPICRWAHAAIDAMRELQHVHGFGHGDIKGIEIATFHNATQLFASVPDTTSNAQYSLAFSVAAMAVHGEIGLPQITEAGLSDARVARLVSLTRTRVAPHLEALYPEGRWANVTVHLADGQSFGSSDTHARGGPERPLDRAEVITKYQALATPLLGPNRTAAIRDATLGLAEGRGYGPLASLLALPL